MARTQLIALILATLFALVSASSAPTFCKCTCFKNSTIIPLGPKSQSSDSSSNSLRLRSPFSNSLFDTDLPAASSGDSSQNIGLAPRSLSKSCSECTKSFCLSQGIDFCKDAKEENVVTMCFQRDSNKDKIIVWGFILGTVGLLGWAAFKRVVELRDKRAMSRQDINYAPVSGERQ
ncbi:MFS transporter [Pochonia chlamydosporia 170]|uniref:MFS transporter n=1 Tax=Pochonia chlamydosporia 170 TaxID=1380566 RepID=A0A179G771_METCM|nr:MFS transporter [Pochonia chlamydosporia 170]OAQ73642.1 MFS transporter [Pochonia chlamydosporia 170]